MLNQPSHAIPIVILPAILMDTVILFSRRQHVDVRSVAPMVAAGLAGIPLGTLVLLTLPVNVLKVLLSSVILISVAMLFRGFTLRTRRVLLARTLAGFTSGTLLTSTGISGPTFSVFLVSLGVPKDRFRPTFSSLFVFLGAASLVSLALSGVFTREVFTLDLMLLPLVFVGFTVAVRLILPRIPPPAFRVVVLLQVTAGAVLALVNAVLALLG